MKLKSLFVFNAITAIIFGVGSVLAPQALVSLYGATLNPAGMLMMRYGRQHLADRDWSASLVREPRRF